MYIKENTEEIITPRNKALLWVHQRLKLNPSPSAIRNSCIRKNSDKVVSFINAYPVVKVHEHDFQFPKRVNIKELLREYAVECEKNKVKCIEKLVKQLNEIEFVEEVIPRLELKGVRLDYKTCESLEIIFMNMQMICLDLESTMLDEESCVAICEILDYYNSMRCLIIGSNTRIGVRGWTALSQLVTRSQSLDLLDLNRMVFTEHAVSNMAKAFKLTTSLKILHLENCYLNGPRLANLLRSFVDSQMAIEELYLGENKITSADCEAISMLIKDYPVLRVLDLQNNPLQDLGLKFIFTGLYERENAHLEVLQLWNTNITSMGMNYISAYFTETLHKHQLYFLRSLNIGKNKIGDEGALALKSSLIKNHTLKRLGLASTRLTTAGIITVAEIIADNKSLLRVDVRENNTNMAAVIALNQAMRHNQTILKLNFNPNFKPEAGMEEEVECVLKEIKSKCIENINRSRNTGKIDDSMSLMSALSTESMGGSNVNSPSSSSSSVSSFILNILTSPFRLSRLRFFGNSSKLDTENSAVDPIFEDTKESPPVKINVEKVSPEPSPECLNPCNQDFPVSSKDPNNTPIKEQLLITQEKEITRERTESCSPVYNVSRFEVRRVPSGVMQHRRSRSDIPSSIKDTSVSDNNLHVSLKHQLSITSSSELLQQNSYPTQIFNKNNVQHASSTLEDTCLSDLASSTGIESLQDENIKHETDLNHINNSSTKIISSFSCPETEKKSVGVLYNG